MSTLHKLQNFWTSMCFPLLWGGIETMRRHFTFCAFLFLIFILLLFLILELTEWMKWFDNKNITEAVLMDMSKAFDCIPHDLPTTKLHPCGFSIDTITIIYSYLKRRKREWTFGPFLKEQPHWFNVNHCICTISTWRAAGAS